MITTTTRSAIAKLLIFAVGVAAGVVLTQAGLFSQSARESGLEELREISGYTFINPLLECEIGSEAIAKGLVPFGDELKDFAAATERASGLDALSVYYRDLNNGPWSGVRERDGFLPASLLKVPIMIAYLKASESEPSVLSEEILYEKKLLQYENASVLVPEETIQIGNSYTVKELMERMIAYSDNEATILLLSFLNEKWLKSVYDRLGVESNIWKGDTMESKTISVKEYAGFFRILYNASFLNRENSEYALEILNRVGFKNGLVAGVPRSVAVAHKFGETGSLPDRRQLHDCGIVYHPSRPYLLCVMTRGSDIEAMAGAIQKVSGFVYKAVDENIYN